ncbi:MAG: hypothetical protein ABWZ25_15125 [Chitinophagaceae bacterium]
MRPYLFILLSLILTINTSAQTFDQLNRVSNATIDAYYSDGHQQRAAAITQRMEKALTYHEHLLGFRPTVTLLILAPSDWNKYTKLSMIYGMPHYTSEKTLIVAAEDNAFWKSFVPPMDQLPVALRDQIYKVYTTEDSSLSMRAFFDLLAIHELAHAFHMQGNIGMQRKWMGELFANIFLHTYISNNEPASLPALTLFPEMVVASGTEGFLFTSLSDIQERYAEIGQQYPRNYGWYQCRWHVAAAAVYNSGGTEVCGKLWKVLRKQKESLSDDELNDLLEIEVDKTLAEIIRHWDRDTVK